MDFFHAIAGLPDLIYGICEHPKKVLCVFLVAVPCVGVYLYFKPPKPKPPIQVEKVEPERRITKIAKWLWEKE